MSTKLQPGGALNIDGYCDNPAEELKHQHPALLLTELNRGAAADADEEDMADFQEFVDVHINATSQDRARHNWDFNWTLPGMMRNWLNREDAGVFDRRMVSAALVGASSFH